MKLRRRIKHRIANFLIKHLTKERPGYTQRFPNDIELLVSSLKPGDVVLIEGSQRVSEVIKYLTQSCWSHAALYVGDSLLSRGGPMAEHLRATYGSEAESMLVEATAESGVVAVPISKYRNHNIRVCRPIRLRPGDLSSVLQTVISQIGMAYSVRHIVDLLRYFFPVTLIPGRLRRTALESAGQFSKQVICSTQITMAFQNVRYPILPRIEHSMEGALQPGGLVERFLAPMRRHRSAATPAMAAAGVFTPCNPRLVTPRDFDLSPYFEIVKFNNRRAGTDFDYKKIVWATVDAHLEVDPATPEGAAAEAPPSRQAAYSIVKKTSVA